MSFALDVHVSAGRVDPSFSGGLFGFLDRGSCGGLASTGVTAEASGTAIDVTIPSATLPLPVPSVSAGTTITSVSATTAFGAYTVSSEVPPQAVTVLIDRGAGGISWTVPDEAPAS